MMGDTQQKKGEAILVVGAGAAGMRASLDLAEMGHKVFLCDKNPNVGGTMVQTDRWFPDNHCGMCKMLPVFSRDDTSQYCLRRGLLHPNIEILPMTEVARVQGDAGDFTVTLKSVPSGVNPDLCIGCGECVNVCPVEVPDQFNEGLNKRKAIFLRNPWMPTNSYVIDWAACTKCQACVTACPTGAINLSPEATSKDVRVGSIVLSTGFEEFDPDLTAQYGHHRYPNVVTSIELERLLSESGPTEGKLLRPGDQKVPRSVAFLQCVGSRDMKRKYCSFACCMYALKEATLIKKLYPETEVEIFYMDMRVFGKGYHRYYQQAVKMGVKFTHSRVPLVKQDFKNGDLLITVAGEDGRLAQRRFEMLVLSVGQTPSPQFKQLAETVGVALNENGFCQVHELTPVETDKPGVFVCGSASGPKDITDSMMRASAAAGRAALYALPAQPAEAAVPTAGDAPPRTAIFLCDCGKEVASIIDMKGLQESCRLLSSVVHVERSPYLCQKDAVKEIKAKMEQHQANRLVLGTCAPFMSRRLAGQVDIDPSLVQVVNLREEVAWPNRQTPAAATSKARALIGMAVERLRLQEPAVVSDMPARQSALVIGGGVAGMVAALTIADLGYEVHILRRGAGLGGRARSWHTTLEGHDIPTFVKSMAEKVEGHPRIHVYQGAEVAEVGGYAGSFDVKLTGQDGAQTSLEVGSIVVATGAERLRTTEYLYGQNENVITQDELEDKLGRGDLGQVKSVAMIQCVGSRDEDRPYCSRICCSEALINAIHIKEKAPDVEVVVFYRDLMSYGIIEKYYTEAREKGVLFVRYDLDSKPQVTAQGGKLKLTAREPALGGKISMEPDLLVLSTPVVPRDQRRLAGLLSVDLDEDGFFQEAEPKFRPVDFLRDGMFICGLAHSPRSLSEAIVQAQAAGQRASTILSKGGLRSGRTVSEVKERWCAGCGMCVSVCPYGARVMDEKKGVAVVIEALCQGCGACVVTCPSGAAVLRGLSDQQVMAMMDAAL